MPTSKKTGEPVVGMEKARNSTQSYRLKPPPGFKKFIVLVGTLAGLTSPPLSNFINNEGGNIVMASPVFKPKKKPEEQMKEMAKDAAYALLTLFKTGDKKELDKVNKIFNTKVDGREAKYQDAFQAELTSILISRTAKDPMLKKFIGEYQKTLPKGEKFNARDFVTKVAEFYTMDSYSAAVEKHGKEFTDAFIDFSTKRIAYNIVKLYVDSLENFETLPKNLKKLEKLGKVKILGTSILEYEEFGSTYSKLYEKKIVNHEIYKEYYSAYVSNELMKAEAQLEAEMGHKVDVKEEDLSISSMDILRAINDSIKLLEKGEEGKKEAKKKYGTLFVYAMGKQYVSKAPSAAKDIQQAAMMKEEIAARHDNIEKDLKIIEKILKTDMFSILKEPMSKYIAEWRAMNESHLINSEKTYANIELLDEIEKDQKELQESVISREDMVNILQLAYYIIDVAETGYIESRQNAVEAAGKLAEIRTDQPEKYKALDACLMKLIEDRNVALFELIYSLNEEATFDKMVKVAQAYQEEDTAKLDVYRDEYGEAFVQLVTHPDATWLTDPEKASYDYMQKTVKARIPPELAKELMTYKFRGEALSFVYGAVTSGDEIQLNQARMMYGEDIIDLVGKNLDYLEWVDGASAKEVRETVNARLLMILGNMTYAGTDKPLFIDNAISTSGKLYSFYNSYKEILDKGVRPGNKYDVQQYQSFVEDWQEKLGGNYAFEQILDFDSIWANTTLKSSLKDAGAKNKSDIPMYLYAVMKVGENEKQSLIDGAYDKYIQSDEELGEMYPDYTSEELEDIKFNNQWKADAFTQIIDGMSQYEMGIFLTVAQPAMEKNGLMGEKAYTAVGRSVSVIMEYDPYLLTSFLTNVVPGIANASPDEETFILAMEHTLGLFETRQTGGAGDFRYSKQEMRPYFKEVFASINTQLPDLITELTHKMVEDELRWGTEAGPYQMPIDPNMYKVKPGWWEEKGLGIPKLYGAQPPTLQLKPKVTMPLDPYLPYGNIPVNSGAVSHFYGMWNSIYPPTDKMFNTQVPNKFHIGAAGKATIISRLSKLFGPMPTGYSDFWLTHFGELGAYAAYEKEEEQKTVKGGATWETIHSTMTGGITEKGKYVGGTDFTEDQYGEVSGIQTHDVEQQIIGGHVPGLGESEIHKIEEEFTFETNAIDDSNKPAEITYLKTTGVLDSYTRLAEENKTDMLVFVNGTYLPELEEGIYRNQFATVSDAHDAALDSIASAQDYIDEQTAAGEDVTELQNLLNQAQTEFDNENYTEADFLARKVEFEPMEYQEEELHLRSKLYFVTQEGDIYQLALGADTEAQLLNYFYGSADTDKVLASYRFLGDNTYKLFDKETPSAEKGMAFDGAAFGMTVGPYAGLALYNVLRNIGTMEPNAVEQAMGNAVQPLIKNPNSKYKHDIFAAFYRGAESLVVTKGVDPNTGLENDTVKKVEIDESVTQTIELMWRHIPPDPKQDPSWEFRTVFPVDKNLTVGAKAKLYFPETGLHLGATAAVTETDYLYEYATVSEQADLISMETRNWLVQLYGWKENDARDAGFFLGGSYMLSQMQEWWHYEAEELELEAEVPKGAKQKHYWSALFIAWAKKNNFLVGAEYVPEISTLADRINDTMQDIQANPENAQYELQSLQSTIKDSFMEDVWRFSLGWGYDGKAFKPYVVAGVEAYEGEVGKVVEDETTGQKYIKYGDKLQQISGNLYALILMGEPHKGYPGKGYLEVTTHLYDYNPKTYEQDMDTGQVNVMSAGNFNYADFYFGVGSLGWPSAGLSWERKDVAFTDYPEGVAKKFNKEEPKVTGTELEDTIKENKKEFLMQLGALSPKMSEKEIEMQMETWSILQGEHLMASGLNENTFYLRVSPRTIEEGALLSAQIGNLEDYHEWVKQGLVLGTDLYRVTLTKDGMVLFGDKKMSMFESFKVIGGITVPIDPEDQDKFKVKGWAVGGLAHLFKSNKVDILGGALYGFKEFAGEEWEGWTMAISARVQEEMLASIQNEHYAYLFVDSLTKEAKFVSSEEIDGEIIQAQNKMSDAERITAGVGYTWTKVNIERGDNIKLHFFFEAGKELKRGKDLGIPQEAPEEKFIGRAGFKFEQSAKHGQYSWFIAGVVAQGDWPYLPASITKPEYLPMWKSTIDYEPDVHRWFMISAGIKW